VGNNDKKQTFRVHKGLLSFYSGYFRAALEGSWTDSNSDVINLDIEDPLVLGRLVLWLYTNKITDESLMSNYTIIIDLWLFADRRDIPLLMNEMIDALHLDMADNWTMPTGRVSDICENTHSGSALRRMIMWSIFRTFDATLLDASGVKLWPQEALLDMLSLALTDRPASNLTKDRYKKVKMCPTYHVHEEGASCTDK
jgi:hypothetical protein